MIKDEDIYLKLLEMTSNLDFCVCKTEEFGVTVTPDNISGITMCDLCKKPRSTPYYLD